MDQDLRPHIRLTIDVLTEIIDFERTLNHPDFDRFIWQLQGILTLLTSVEGVDDLKAEIEALIADMRAN